MDGKKTPKNASEYKCEKCAFSTRNKNDYARHCATRKHSMRHNETKCNKNETTPTERLPSQYTCPACMGGFNSRSTLWRHRKTCSMNAASESEPQITACMFMKVLNDNQELRDLLFLQQQQMNEQQQQSDRKQEELMEQMKKQQQQMAELIPRVGNTTNNNNQSFNLQFFLNEQCKDAINWEDFMKTLQVGAPEFAAMTDSTLTEGVAKVICNGIQDLGVYKRPIHCIDAKRRKMCIKDEDMWNHDEEKVNGTLHQANLSVKGKYNHVLKVWEKAHPNWSDDEEETETYMRLLSKVVGTLDEKKCATEIARNAVIPKEDPNSVL